MVVVVVFCQVVVWLVVGGVGGNAAKFVFLAQPQRTPKA